MIRTVLVCHAENDLNRVGVARWLASFSQLVGIVMVREPPARMWRRIRRELRRVGPLRFLDVLGFQLYYRLLLAARDGAWRARTLERLCRRYPPPRPEPDVLETSDPNSAEARAFMQRLAPDLALARCKTLLKEDVFSIPVHGTFVLHPGICPEYRNAHGCFWALANDDLSRVGTTLLKIDRGVDTGPVYGYYGYPFDEVVESHAVIQHRVVLENLPAIARTLVEICERRATALDTAGRRSATWGQPWLTRYLQWKHQARRRRRAGSLASLS